MPDQNFWFYVGGKVMEVDLIQSFESIIFKLLLKLFSKSIPLF